MCKICQYSPSTTSYRTPPLPTVFWQPMAVDGSCCSCRRARRCSHPTTLQLFNKILAILTPLSLLTDEKSSFILHSWSTTHTGTNFQIMHTPYCTTVPIPSLEYLWSGWIRGDSLDRPVDVVDETEAPTERARSILQTGIDISIGCRKCALY